MDPERPLLVVLDLNGVLLDRRDRRERAPDVPAAATIARTRVYLRPYVLDFLAWLRERVTVAVWTSARGENAAKLCALLGLHAESLLFLWDQSMCTVLPLPDGHGHHRSGRRGGAPDVLSKDFAKVCGRGGPLLFSKAGSEPLGPRRPVYYLSFRWCQRMCTFKDFAMCARGAGLSPLR